MDKILLKIIEIKDSITDEKNIMITVIIGFLICVLCCVTCKMLCTHSCCNCCCCKEKEEDLDRGIEICNSNDRRASDWQSAEMQ